MIKYSIITATFNAEKELSGLLESISIQKDQHVELIVIDGGSSDRTLDIIKENISCIDYWISEADKGIYDAWNKGIQKARGEWILFLGADDRLLEGALSQYSKFIEENDTSNVDFISAQNRYIKEDGSLIKIIGSEAKWDVMRKRMSAAHVGALHNAKLFQEIGCYNCEYKICADYELLLRKKENLRALFVNKQIAIMKTGGMSFSVKAIKETCVIRGAHRTIPSWENSFLYMRDILAFYIFKLKHFL